ncbi:MAG: hypothetical protein ABIF71_02455 [Planctomycetota bacterium]
MVEITAKLLTKGEVVKILRLDQKTVKSPVTSLRYLVRTRQLMPMKICGELLFDEGEVYRFIDACRKKAAGG